jgi:ABC-2 type transport system permease protein
MSTVIADNAPQGIRVRTAAVDPATAVARARPHVGLGETVSQTFSMAWRALKKMRRNPEQFFDVTLQPLLFTAMFAYIFGGAISGNVKSYLPLLIPGIVAQTVLTTCMSTGVQLREDMEKGVFDRFKALPIARIAPLAGPMMADLVRYLIAAGLTFVSTIARNARSVQGISMLILFPLTFLSNAFVPVRTLPSALADFVKVNPVSHLVSASRDLANLGVISGEVGWTLLAGLVVIVIFAPLSVYSYKRHL